MKTKDRIFVLEEKVKVLSEILQGLLAGLLLADHETITEAYSQLYIGTPSSNVLKASDIARKPIEDLYRVKGYAIYQSIKDRFREMCEGTPYGKTPKGKALAEDLIERLEIFSMEILMREIPLNEIKEGHKKIIGEFEREHEARRASKLIVDDITELFSKTQFDEYEVSFDPSLIMPNEKDFEEGE